MKALFWIGMVVLIVGIASLFVPIPTISAKASRPATCPSALKPARGQSVPVYECGNHPGGAGMMVVGRREVRATGSAPFVVRDWMAGPAW